MTVHREIGIANNPQQAASSSEPFAISYSLLKLRQSRIRFELSEQIVQRRMYGPVDRLAIVLRTAP
jgi:hypothetical protein